MSFVMVDRHSDLHHHSFSIFFTPSEASHGGLDLERNGVGRQPPKPPPGGWSGNHASFVFLKSNSSCIAGTRCRHFDHFHCPDKLAGRRRMPCDLNFPKDVQIFDMAFAERVSMVSITRRATS
ncbi:hypothetical protein ACC808_03865 [Rhizobium ruizarguesonis]